MLKKHLTGLSCPTSGVFRKFLTFMVIGDAFINMIKTLNTNPSATVITVNNLWPLFIMTKSSRQGDPLSLMSYFYSLIFILAIEPLAQTIKKYKLIKPIIFHLTKHFISLYADDILLFFEDVRDSLPNILFLTEVFSQIYSDNINWLSSAHGTGSGTKLLERGWTF